MDGDVLYLPAHEEDAVGLLGQPLHGVLRQGPAGPYCLDSTDYLLPVRAGDRLAIVRRTSRGALAKKDGVTGWYLGKLGPA